MKLLSLFAVALTVASSAPTPYHLGYCSVISEANQGECEDLDGIDIRPALQACIKNQHCYRIYERGQLKARLLINQEE